MTDEADEPLVEVTDCGAEWHTYSTGCVVFPKGIAEFAESVHALAIRIADKTGDIEILEAIGKAWRAVQTPDGPRPVASIRK